MSPSATSTEVPEHCGNVRSSPLPATWPFLTGQNAGSGLFHVWMNTTGRSDSSALVQALARLPSRRRRWPDSRPGARVGVMYARWTNAQPLDIHAPPISNACTDLQRTYPALTAVGRRTPDRCTPTLPPGADAEPDSRPGARVGVMCARWTNAQPLDIHAPPISNACTDLQRTYPTLTAVGRRRANPHPRGPDNRSRSGPTLHASERGRQVIEDC